nr:cupredoxin domain-containing protein [Methylobacterium oxalidis]
MRKGRPLRLAWLLGLAACPVSSAVAETIQIRVEDLGFVPAQVSAHVGDTVEWVSRDFVAHTATARDGRWDVAIPADGKGRITLTRAGAVAYYCRYHPGMIGSISITAPP